MILNEEFDKLRREILICNYKKEDPLSINYILNNKLNWDKIPNYTSVVIKDHIIELVSKTLLKNGLSWEDRRCKFIYSNEILSDMRFKHYHFQSFDPEKRTIFLYLTHICKSKRWNIYKFKTQILKKESESNEIKLLEDLKNQYKQLKSIDKKLGEYEINPSTLNMVHHEKIYTNSIKSVSIQLDPPLGKPVKITTNSDFRGTHIIQRIIEIAELYAQEKGKTLLECIVENTLGPIDLNLIRNIKDFSISFKSIWNTLYPNDSTLKIAEYLQEFFCISLNKNESTGHNLPTVETIRSWVSF